MLNFDPELCYRILSSMTLLEASLILIGKILVLLLGAVLLDLSLSVKRMQVI